MFSSSLLRKKKKENGIKNNENENCYYDIQFPQFINKIKVAVNYKLHPKTLLNVLMPCGSSRVGALSSEKNIFFFNSIIGRPIKCEWAIDRERNFHNFNDVEREKEYKYNL